MKKGFNIFFKLYFVVFDKSVKNGWNLKVILNFFVVLVGILVSGVFKNVYDIEMLWKLCIFVMLNNNVIFCFLDVNDLCCKK